MQLTDQAHFWHPAGSPALRAGSHLPFGRLWWPVRLACTSGRALLVGLVMLECDPGQFDARPDVEFAEHLAQGERDGVGAAIYLVGHLLVGHALRDEAGRGPLGVGEALPTRHRPSLLPPMAAPYSELT